MKAILFAKSCLGKCGQNLLIGQFDQKNDVRDVVDEFVRIDWSKFVQLEDKLGFLDGQLFDLFDFVQQIVFGFRSEELTFRKYLITVLRFVSRELIVHFGWNERSSFWYSAVQTFAESFSLWSKFCSNHTSNVACTGSSFIFLELFLDPEVLCMVNDISNADLRSWFHSGGWWRFELFDFFFEFGLAFVSLLELTLTEFKLTFQLLNSRVFWTYGNISTLVCCCDSFVDSLSNFILWFNVFGFKVWL